MKKKINISVKDIALMAILSTFMIAFKELLSWLANIQLTMLFLIVFTKTLGLKKTSIILITYMIVDNLIWGSFDLIYTPVMFIGWFITPLLLTTIFKKVENNILIGLISVLGSFLYSWSYVLPSCLIYQMSFVDYMIGDIYYELAMATSSFVSVLILYQPLKEVINKYYANRYDRLRLKESKKSIS